MELQEISRDRTLAFRSRRDEAAEEVGGWTPDEPRHEEVERILLLRSASLELHRVLTGS